LDAESPLECSDEEEQWLRYFVSCIEQSTKKKRLLDEALQIKQQHIPDKVYKYREINEYSLDNLKNDTIWLNTPENFNDPFDSVFNLSEEYLKRSLNMRFLEKLIAYHGLKKAVSNRQLQLARESSEPLETLAECISKSRKFNTNNPAQIISLQKPISRVSSASSSLANGKWNEIQSWIQLMYTCSFSTVPDSILMWSHYADNHKGICIEYDLNGVGADHPFRKCIFPVIYSDKPYNLNPWIEKLVAEDTNEFNPDWLVLGLLHKYCKWRYEKEWRVVPNIVTKISGGVWPVPAPSKFFLVATRRKKQKRKFVKSSMFAKRKVLQFIE